MPEPVEYRVLANLKAALQAIATSGGYFYTVDDAAVKLDPNVDVETLIGDAKARPFVLIEAFPEEWEYQPALQLEMRMPVTVHWVHQMTETADEVRLLTFFRGCADVETAITRDITRGGLAIDTRITKRALFKELDGAEVWAQLALEIRVYRTYGAPNG